MRKLIILAAIAVAIAGASLVLVANTPELRWRAEVTRLKVTGEVPELGFLQLIKMMLPGSIYYVEGLARGKSAFSVIENPYASGEDLAAGEVLYRANCATCHEHAGQDSSALSLFDGSYAVGDSDWALYLTVRDGVPGTAMAAQSLTERQIWQVLTYVRHMASTANRSATEGQTLLSELAPVTFERITNWAREPHNWLTYSGALEGHRCSPLEQVTKDNVAELKLGWVYQGMARDIEVEATPLVVDGIMISSEPPNEVVALDAATGDVLWRYSRNLPTDLRYCCGPVNRGIAILGEAVYVGTLDAHLVALDIRTGNVLWDVETAEHSLGYSNTAAPLAVNDLIVVGMAGGEFGTRGFIDAYQSKSGKRVWRFWTVPEQGNGEPTSWPGDSWRTGGGPTWMTGSYDSSTGLLYWGVGNPGPDFNNETREGDNLYTNSVVALDPKTGTLRWYFQFTPGDVHDYDANHVPIVVDVSYGGELRRALLMATKNGFFYVLDAQTGEFLLATAFTRQTWALEIAADGRPVKNPDATPSTKGTRVYPGAGGGTNWWPPSYGTANKLFYLPVSEKGAIFFSHDHEYDPGKLFVGGSSANIPGEPNRTVLRAIEPATGAIAWEFDEPHDSTTARTGGTLSTASGIVFWGNDSTFFALDAETGRKLWDARLGGQISSAPMTYAVAGKQYVTVAAGRALFTFSL